ncbi:MAG: CHASE domain-containing protein [Polaromonas sp.]|nr:CHASE domain-containing protein [Polaromonas sp.]
MKIHVSATQVGARLLETLIITALYGALGKLCLTLPNAFMAGPLPLLWLPAALALAAFMQLGWRASAGVWLGALAAGSSLISGDINQHAVASLVLIASGSTAQAALAAWLIGRFLGIGQFTTPASQQRMVRMTPLRLATFMTVLIALATTLVPSIDTASLVLSGEAPRSAEASLTRTWWMGDLVGMLSFGPLLYFLALKFRKMPFQRDSVLLSLACLLMGMGILELGVDEQSFGKQKIKSLSADASELIAMHDGLMQAQVMQMFALKALFESSKVVSPNEFQTFSAELLKQDPVTSVLSWAPRIPAADRAHFEKQMHREGDSSFVIFEHGAAGKKVATGVRDTYFPITRVEPLAKFGHIQGFDLGSDALRLAAIQQATTSGRLTASAPTHLVQSPSGFPVVLTMAPVYQQDMPLASASQRQQALSGVIVSAFQPDARFTEIRRGLRPTHTEYFVFDQANGANGVESQLIASSASNENARPHAHLEPEQLRQGLYVEHTYEFLGRQRLMIVRPDQKAAPMMIHWEDWLIIAFCFLLAGTLLQFQGQREAQDMRLKTSTKGRTEQAEFTQQLLEQLPIGVALRTAQGDFIDANPAFLTLLGRAHAPFKAMTNAEVTPPEYQALDAAQIISLQTTGSYGPVEKEYVRPDGSRVQVQVSGRNVTLNGRTVLLSVAEDISVRRKAEFRQAQSQKMDAIGQLTGGLAHDFNNMLGIIIGSLDLLASQLGANEPAQARLNIALTAALRGADLTRGLLAVARTQTVSQEAVDLSNRLNELLPLMQHTAGKAVEVTLSLEDKLMVEVDPGGLASTVLNLVINARDAMPDGGRLTLSSKLRTIQADEVGIRLKPGQYAELSVSDTGKGMGPEVLARALDPFFTTKERGRGTGLGLSMAHGFVKQCGGDLTIYSESGHGTTLRLMLPIVAAADAGTTTGTADLQTAEAMPHGHERVLVVDDEIELLAVTANWLKALGYEVTPCATPTSALAALRDGITAGRPYTLMVTDVIMPGMNGFELARAARVDQPDMALLYISGFADVADRGLERPGGAILEKPFRQPALATLVRQALTPTLKETS